MVKNIWWDASGQTSQEQQIIQALKMVVERVKRTTVPELFIPGKRIFRGTSGATNVILVTPKSSDDFVYCQCPVCGGSTQRVMVKYQGQVITDGQNGDVFIGADSITAPTFGCRDCDTRFVVSAYTLVAVETKAGGDYQTSAGLIEL